MCEPSINPLEHTITRREIVRTGARLAYAAPLISASFGLTTLSTSAVDTISSESAVKAVETTVADKGSKPVAVPGEGFEVVDNDLDGFETVTVDGSASSDPDGSIVSYRWTLGDQWLSNDAVATVTLPVGTHRLELTVTDDSGATGSAKIRIRVKRGKRVKQPEPAQEEPTPTPEPAQPTLPPAPRSLKAKQKFAEVALTWKIDDGTPVPFHVYRTVDDGLGRPVEQLEWVLIWEEWQQLSYRDAAVEPWVPYLYVVRSFDGINESDYSNVAAITLEPVDQPAQEQSVEEAPPTVEEAPAEPTEAPTVEESAVEEPTPAPAEAAPADSTDEAVTS